jgi:gamma-aminobutyric acid receptor subunit alpha
MDCYFRQQWTDSRLRFEGNETLRVSVNILERLWKPDTHVFNGRQSYLHTVTSPNKLLRINPDGSILYSMR